MALLPDVSLMEGLLGVGVLVLVGAWRVRRARPA